MVGALQKKSPTTRSCLPLFFPMIQKHPSSYWYTSYQHLSGPLVRVKVDKAEHRGSWWNFLCIFFWGGGGWGTSSSIISPWVGLSFAICIIYHGSVLGKKKGEGDFLITHFSIVMHQMAIIFFFLPVWFWKTELPVLASYCFLTRLSTRFWIPNNLPIRSEI